MPLLKLNELYVFKSAESEFKISFELTNLEIQKKKSSQ